MNAGQTLLVPARSRRVRVSDSFTRADNNTTLGNAETNQLWTPGAGTWGVIGGQAYSVTDATGNHATLDAGMGNGLVTSLITSSAYASESGGVIARYQDASNFLICDFTATVVRLLKCVAGVFTVLGNAANTPVDGTQYRLTMIVRGASVVVRLNGVVKVAYTLTAGEQTTFPTTLTRYGVRLSKAAPATLRFDNFQVVRVI